MINPEYKLLKVVLPSGNQAVYAVHITGAYGSPSCSRNSNAIEFGEQFAHKAAGRWYLPGGPLRHAWHEITDRQTLELIEGAEEA